MRHSASPPGSSRGRVGPTTGRPSRANTSSAAAPRTGSGTCSPLSPSGTTTGSATTESSECGPSSEEHDPPGTAAFLVNAGVLAAGPVVPPDPLQVRDLDQDQRHDREEEEISAHHPTVSAGWAERNRPI